MLNKNINKTLFNSKFIKVEIKDGFFCVQEPWCNNEGVGILPYVLKDNEYYFLQLHNENNPAHKKDRVSEYSTITGGLENQQFYTTILNEMLEETGIDISENVIIDRFNYSFANKSSDKKWFLYAIDLTNLNLDITKTYYGKSGDGTEFEKGIHAKFVNSFTLAGSIDNISSSIWGKWDLIRRYKEKENKIFLKNVINPKKIKQGFNKKIDLSELFNKEYFDNKNWFGFPLHYAVYNGYFEITKWLLENGADINIKDENGCTPLQIAIASPNNNVNFIKFLLENGADINIKDENDNNLLDIAIKNDKIEVVKLLLIQPNIDIDIKNYYIQQLLFYSANNGHLNSFNALLENGA
ncbi:ankyrin repeat domain-containing protein, partial [Spiroplasma endosymbiont of Lariophagus distinguendus]|uniref:ankyrin repeat domain-containing protein n=1 Tax=Spiroplasma endosymbiont of Lariophagus distinguendus TaxID=2935082 RepID=UPI00207A0E26